MEALEKAIDELLSKMPLDAIRQNLKNRGFSGKEQDTYFEGLRTGMMATIKSLKISVNDIPPISIIPSKE